MFTEDFKLTFYLSIKDKMLRDRIDNIICPLEGIYISDDPAASNVAVVDSQTFIDEQPTYEDSFESILIILLHQNIDDKDLMLSNGASFFLKANSSDLEIEQKAKLIKEYFSFKYQSQILNNLFNKAENSIVITDAAGVIKYANQYFVNETGYTSDELIGKTARELKSGLHDEEFYREMWEKIQNGISWTGIFVNKNKKGKLFYEEANITPIFNNLGKITSYLKIGRVVERERLLANELNQEIKKAKDMIAYMLPIKYEDESVSLESRLKAYNYLGGDFICFEKLSDSRYVLSLIDVMGHGASATMIGLKAITVFQTAIYYESLIDSVDKVNTVVLELNKDDYFITRYISGVFIEIDLEKRTINYISAGHPKFYARYSHGLYTYSSNNMILGISNDIKIVSHTIDMDDIEYIYLYSDGLIENRNDQERGPSIDLAPIIHEAEKNENHFLKTILDMAIGQRPIDDDITMAQLKFKNQRQRLI